MMPCVFAPRGQALPARARHHQPRREMPLEDGHAQDDAGRAERRQCLRQRRGRHLTRGRAAKVLDPITARLLRGAGGNGPIMLMYHAIEPGGGTPAWPWSVSLRRFERHLDLLCDHGWHTRVVRDMRSARPADHAPRTVVLTFDDGFANNMSAFHALVRRGMRASWFIVTGAIGQRPRWTDGGRPPGRMLDPGELRAMHAAGMEIGSHGEHHDRLPQLHDEALEGELANSRRQLEDVLGERVDSFAYPYGAWDARCEQAVMRAGYRLACTTMTGHALKDQNPYRLRRLTITHADTDASLARKLAFVSNDAGWGAVARYAVSRITGRPGTP